MAPVGELLGGGVQVSTPTLDTAPNKVTVQVGVTAKGPLPAEGHAMVSNTSTSRNPARAARAIWDFFFGD